VTLEEIDQLLADWRKKIDLVGQNLIDLNSLPTYQRLCGAYGFPKAELTGITQARVTPALEAMNDLFQHFDLLLKTVEKATELRQQVLWFLGSEQKIHQIQQILTGQSIQLPAVQTPLLQRGLLSAAVTANAIAPDQLLQVMTNAFEVAKDAVLAVDQAWLALEPTLADAAAEILSLQKLADSLHQDDLRELKMAREAIASLRDHIESDPLGVSSDFDREIKPLISQVKTTLEQLEQQQTQIQHNLATAHQQLQQLVELQAATSTAFAESQEKVTDYSPRQTPLSSEHINALKTWLNRLEAKFAEGLMHPVRIGLENWTTKVKEYITAEERAYTTNKAPLEMRQELRGRLDALKVKAQARGLAEDPTLTAIAFEAKQLLYTRPTPLAKAAELVSKYEKQLNSTSK